VATALRIWLTLRASPWSTIWIVAHRRRHLVDEFDRGVVAFHRQLANQAREQGDDSSMTSSCRAVVLESASSSRPAFRIVRVSPGRRRSVRSLREKGGNGTVGVAVKKGRAVAGRQHLDADLELVEVRWRPLGLFRLEERVAQDVDGQAQREEGFLLAGFIALAGGVKAPAALPYPATEFLHRHLAGVVPVVEFHVTGEATPRPRRSPALITARDVQRARASGRSLHAG
jgi:hypothetical protein